MSEVIKGAVQESQEKSDLMGFDETHKDFFGELFSRWSLYKLVETNSIPHIRMGSGKRSRILFRRSTLTAWLTEKEKESLGQQVAPQIGVLRVAK